MGGVSAKRTDSIRAHVGFVASKLTCTCELPNVSSLSLQCQRTVLFPTSIHEPGVLSVKYSSTCIVASIQRWSRSIRSALASAAASPLGAPSHAPPRSPGALPRGAAALAPSESRAESGGSASSPTAFVA
jgi:hypothetical protein